MRPPFLERRALALTLLSTVALSAGGAAAGEVPPGTEVMSVDRVPGKMGPVKFTHGAHSARYPRADGGPTRCRDCHHTLAADAPAGPLDRDRMRCSACHASLDEPVRRIDGKLAPALATLRPDGAVEYKSILFHTYCWGCHREVANKAVRGIRCKVCHERGVGEDTIAGRYDAARQPGTSLSWLRCPAGVRWDGKRCEGEAHPVSWPAASASCPEGYRLPTRAELAALLAGCNGKARCGCGASASCAVLFGDDGGTYWTSDAGGERRWTVRLADGAEVAAPATGEVKAQARCVKTEP